MTKIIPLLLLSQLFSFSSYACSVQACETEFNRMVKALAENKTKWAIEISKIAHHIDGSCFKRTKEIDQIPLTKLLNCDECTLSELGGIDQESFQNATVDKDGSPRTFSESETIAKLQQELHADIIHMLNAKCEVSANYIRTSR